MSGHRDWAGGAVRVLRTAGTGLLALASWVAAMTLLYVAARHTSWLVFLIMTIASAGVWAGVTAIVKGVRADQRRIASRFAEQRPTLRPMPPVGRDVPGTHRPGIDPPPSRDR